MTEEPLDDLLNAARAEATGEGVDPVSPSGEQAGDVIDRYKLLEELGEGGMGTVWMAEQTDPVQRRVALKIIKLGMDTKEVIARFEAERQALALMDHPHIARVFDGGATKSGRPFFVMELVKGVPITRYCNTAKLDLRERLDLFSKVCHALQHAHQKGIIHRDVKPSNILVTISDGVAAPKIIDFGIAKATSSALTRKTLFTHHTRIIGTPEYMAPEQAELTGLDIDTRADVYSLGVLLYELLTGTKPFDLDAALEDGYQEMLRTIREDEPVRPSTRVSTLDHTPTEARPPATVDRLSSRLRGDLDWIVMKALEKDRNRRYDSASSFADDIRKYLVDEPVAAGPPSRGYRIRKMIRRNRTAVLVGTGFAMLLLVGAVAATVGWLHVRSVNADLERALGEKETLRVRAEGNASKARIAAREAEEFARQADEERDHAREEERRAHRVAGLLKEMLVSAGPLVAAGMDTELMRTILDDMGERLLRGEIEDRRVAVDLHGTIGDTYRELHVFDRSEEHIRRAIEMVEEDTSDDDARLLRTRTLLAGLEVARFREQAALDAIRPLESWEERLGLEHDAVLEARLIEARALANAGRLAEAQAILEPLVEVRERTLGPEHPETVAARLSLEWTRLQIGSSMHTEGALEELIRTARMHGRNALTTMLAEKTLARLYYDRGRRADSEALTRELMQRSEQAYGPGYRLTVDLRLFYATILHESGRTRQADRLLSQIVEEATPHMGADGAGIRAARLTHGLQLMANGVRGQRGALDRARTILQENLDQDVDESEPNVAPTRQAMMMVCAYQNDFDCVDELLAKTWPAIEDLQHRFDRGEARVDSHTFTLLKTLTNVGSQYLDQRRFEDGLELLAISLPIKRGVLGDDHPFTGFAAFHLARAYEGLDRTDEAADAWRQYSECALARVDVIVRMGETAGAISELESALSLAEGKTAEEDRLRARLEELRATRDG